MSKLLLQGVPINLIMRVYPLTVCPSWAWVVFMRVNVTIYLGLRPATQRGCSPSDCQAVKGSAGWRNRIQLIARPAGHWILWACVLHMGQRGLFYHVCCWNLYPAKIQAGRWKKFLKALFLVFNIQRNSALPPLKNNWLSTKLYSLPQS